MPRFDPGVTAKLIVEAGQHLRQGEHTPTLLADGGVENFNGVVDALVAEGTLRRVLAQIDVSYSNSLIEAWWRQLKHPWLCMNKLDSITHVCKLVAFYVEEHNSRIPHAAFKGQTPDEIYFGTGEDVPDQLARAREQARLTRMKANRAKSCSRCA